MNPASDGTTDTDYRRPRDPVEIWLARQWQEILGFTVGIRQNFFGLGGNSLDAARVINAVLMEFGIQLRLNVLTEHPTIESLATLLRPNTPHLAGPLVPIQDGDHTRPPLILIHPDNGQIAPYCHLAHALGEEFTVLALQATGLHSPTQPHHTVTAMTHTYLDALHTALPTGPYLLGGSGDIGAAIAHEMAARLDDVRLVAAIGTELEPSDGTASWSHELPRPAELPQILADWQERDLVPQDVAPEFVARSLGVWQANRAAVRDWRPSPRSGQLDLFDRSEITDLPATVVQRHHECGTGERLADALRDLIG